MNATEFEDKYISKLQCNLEVVKSRTKYKDIESLYSDVRKKNIESYPEISTICVC